MDVLSQAIGVARTGLPTSYRIECHAPWGRIYAPVPGIGFHVVLEGSAWLLPGPVPLEVGDVVVLPDGRGHGLADRPSTPLLPLGHGPDNGSRVVGPDGPGAAGGGAVLLCGMYSVDRERPHPLFRDLPDVVRVRSGTGALRAVTDLLAEELRAGRPGTQVAVTALLDLLLVHVFRTWYDDRPGVGWGAALDDPTVGAALRAIHAEPSRQWTVAELGALTGMSRAAFARRFSRLAGEGPLSYLTRWRMTLAADLLRRVDAPLGAIGRQVGYTSEYAFANAFKREHGVAPGRYRRSAAG